MKFDLYQKAAFVTIASTLFLIFVGGLVRSTGAGMGCPDWPKCFGEWIPPTAEEQLPADYEQAFLEERLQKNRKISNYLRSAGFEELATEIENDPKVAEAEPFNAVKTWTEYINRLIGALVGLFIFLTFLFSLRYRKKDPVIPLISGLAVVLTGFQGWLGSIVVSTNLLPGTISIHMVLAMVIVNVLIYGAYRASSGRIRVTLEPRARKIITTVTVIALILSVVQMVLGTQVREAVDVAKLIAGRGEWLDNAGTIFLIHRSFSWTLVITGGLLFWLIRNYDLSGLPYTLAILNLALIAFQVLLGIGLERLDMPPSFQVLHLVGVAFLICTQFLLFLMIKRPSYS